MAVPQALIDELTNDPLGRGYAVMTAQQAYDALHAKDRPYFEPLASRTVLKWAAANERLQKIVEATNDVAKSRAIKAICHATLTLIKHPEAQFDFNDNATIALFDALIAGGVLTQADKDSAQTLSTNMRSRVAELSIARASLGHVIAAKAIIGGA